MINVPELFSSYVFNDGEMRKRLSEEDYLSFKKTVSAGLPLDKELASAVADAMKNWAIEKGATHFTHWFQPMTGITAEKHDSFISPVSDGKVIMNFSGKELIKGEGDASSFPNGGLRSTFEARGYTVWDPTSFAFVKDGALCIPTAFCAYSGQVLDKKTPLLRSSKVISQQAKRLLAALGKHTDSVTVTVGPEQEYFLIDKDMYLKRKDLIFTGRTLFGANPPKGQEMDDHYYGNIRPRVLAFMEDLDKELWKFGILAKTRHNEVAPAQHELAPIYTVINVAADQNQLTMEMMKKIAEQHNLICLLNEKPFAGVNGSGKHDNWSLSTSDGENLLNPGKNPQDNLPFLLILTAVIAGVDRHQDLLRLSVASAGNDHRLGASEAPPAIVSMYLGDELMAVMEAISTDTQYVRAKSKKMNMADGLIPEFKKDTTDRNRTSPFAFTGNKFEFRMPGSEFNISCPNVMINTAVAEALDEFATALENSEDKEKTAKELIKNTYNAHKRIIFNGNGYSEEWKEEAKKRGLLNIDNTPEALLRYPDKKNVELLGKYGIFTEEEIHARMEILLENYCKTLNIEARTMIEMTNKEILPSCMEYMRMLSDEISKKASICIPALTETDLLKKISVLVDKAYDTVKILELATDRVGANKNAHTASVNYRTAIFPTMNELRKYCDELEKIVGKKYWPFPTYSDLLFSV
ncbi:MAG: glutamine synthetase III [Clostridia bacterium]|nr:glutamine synthetase III [Clostridia bacterium]